MYSIIIGHFRKYHYTLCLSPKFYLSIVFVFSRDHCKSQEKLETMLMQNFGGQSKSIMVFSEMAYILSVFILLPENTYDASWTLKTCKSSFEMKE